MSCLYFLNMRCFSSSESMRWGDIPAARHRSYRQYVQSFRFFRYTGHRPCSEQTNKPMDFFIRINRKITQTSKSLAEMFPVKTSRHKDLIWSFPLTKPQVVTHEIMKADKLKFKKSEGFDLTQNRSFSTFKGSPDEHFVWRPTKLNQYFFYMCKEFLIL
jgi:hypothetical protein